MSNRNYYYGPPRTEDREKAQHLLALAGITLALLIIAYGGPYLLVYVVPFIAISATFGYGWLLACQVSEKEREYQRLAFLIPATLIGASALLLVIKLSVVSWMMDNNHSLIDPLNGVFRGIYNGWYAYIPLMGRTESVSFCYAHLCGIVGMGLLIGAPWLFCQLVEKDAAIAKHHHNQWLYDEDKKRAVEHQAALKEAEAVRKKYQAKADAFDAAVKARNNEIERLRRREKYLTEGKPKPLEATPDKPDLDFL